MNGDPMLLDVGVHFLNEPSFQFGRFCRVDDPRITVGLVNILTVPRGMIVPVIVNGEGHFVLEGRHFIKQNRIDIHRAQKFTDEYICAGTRHRIVVPQGRLGLALASGAPCIYDPNSVHLINSSLFEYRGSVDVTQQLIVHASLKIITVKDGQVGITYNNGVLEMLQTGRHTIEKATHGARCCACECARAFFGGLSAYVYRARRRSHDVRGVGARCVHHRLLIRETKHLLLSLSLSTKKL